ncbi:MAG: hypothetical protein NTX50_12505 [Candidatus Sumerlaeota bacterium]|nr:hypothetical protein [Candidatus Sumerlaeota bacterium]
MRANTFLQILMMGGIVGLVYLVIQTTQHPAQKVGSFVVPTPMKPTSGTLTATSATAGLRATSGTARTVMTSVTAIGDLSLGPTVYAFASMDKSKLFDVIMTPPPTPTPPIRTPPTPRPPPPIEQVVKATMWRLATVWKGKADIEVMGKNEWITLKVGDTREITFAQQNCVLQVVGMNDKEQTLTLKFGDQPPHIMKAF